MVLDLNGYNGIQEQHQGCGWVLRSIVRGLNSARHQQLIQTDV
ncbi:MAG: hypothetical protein ACJARL_001437 [Halopseudomonas sp.]|jgi:hypothetical protein